MFYKRKTISLLLTKPSLNYLNGPRYRTCQHIPLPPYLAIRACLNLISQWSTGLGNYLSPIDLSLIALNSDPVFQPGQVAPLANLVPRRYNISADCTMPLTSISAE